MDNKLLFKFKAFSGINNINPSFRLPVNVQDKDSIGPIADLAIIENMDIGNQYELSIRPGCDLKVSGTDIHSLWSDGDVAFFVDGTVLYALFSDYSITELKTDLVPNSQMSYAKVNDRIYMTNGSFIGYYKNYSISSLAQSSITYKLPLPAGQCIAVFQGKLYVASGSVLYMGDALSDHYDMRHGFRAFSNNITIVRPVEKGIYVSAEKTYFVSRIPVSRLDEPDEFRREVVLDSVAIRNTDIEIMGPEIKDGMNGICAMWTSEDGICFGDGNGKVTQITEDKYKMSGYSVGSACLRKINGVSHYVATLG